MGSFPHRIGRISDNLRVIQDEISILAQQELAMLSDGLSIGDPDVKALRRVKTSVDHLRQVLRSYIDFASAHVEQGPEQLAEERMRRTTLILRYACDRLQMDERRRHGAPASLFDQLMAMAFAAVDRQREDAPVEMATAAADD